MAVYKERTPRKHIQSSASSYLERLGPWQCISIIWRATPHVLKLVALPYNLITYTRLLAESGDLDTLKILHITMFGRSRVFRLLRPRYRIIMRLLGSATTVEAKHSNRPSPRKPGAGATGRTHQALGKAKSKVSPKNRSIKENVPESTGGQLETAKQHQQANCLQLRQSLELPWLSLHRGCGCSPNKRGLDLLELSDVLSHDEKLSFLNRLHAAQYWGLTATADSSWLGGRCHCPLQSRYRAYPRQGEAGGYCPTASPLMGDDFDLFAARTHRVWPRDVIHRQGNLQCSKCKVNTCVNAVRPHELDATINGREFDWLNKWLLPEIFTQDHTVSGCVILHSDPVLGAAAACVSPAVDDLVV